MFNSEGQRFRAWLSLWVAVALFGSFWTVQAVDERIDSHERSSFPSSSPLVAREIVEVSGFEVSVLSATTNGLYTDVDVAVLGQPELGDDLFFGPGPQLVWPNGERAKLTSGKNEGRTMSLRFDRPSLATASDGDELTMLVYSIQARSANGDVPVNRPAPAVALKVPISAASNAKAVNLGEQVSIGPGTLTIDAAWTDDGLVRIIGHFQGFSASDAQLISVRRSTLHDEIGQVHAPISVRFGAGTKGDQFYLDYEVPADNAREFALAISADTTRPGREPSADLASILGTVLERPIALSLATAR